MKHEKSSSHPTFLISKAWLERSCPDKAESRSKPSQFTSGETDEWVFHGDPVGHRQSTQHVPGVTMARTELWFGLRRGTDTHLGGDVQLSPQLPLFWGVRLYLLRRKTSSRSLHTSVFVCIHVPHPDTALCLRSYQSFSIGTTANLGIAESP